MRNAATDSDRPLWASVAAVLTSPPILRDGSVEGIGLVESSGDFLLDQAALRTLEVAKPFSPLPKHYEKDRCTIRGVFRPE